MRTHTQERPYICPHCNKAFSRSDNLAQYAHSHITPPSPITYKQNFQSNSSTHRHRRTHDRGDGSDGPYGYSGEEEDYEGEDNLGSLEEASPNSENGYLPTSMAQSFHNMQSMSMSMAAPSQLINTQHHMMQQPI